MISRVSSFRFSTESVDLEDIGKQLGVSHLITGSIRSLENQYLITVDCTELQSTTNVWSLSREYPADDFRTIETGISQAVITRRPIKGMDNIEFFNESAVAMSETPSAKSIRRINHHSL